MILLFIKDTLQFYRQNLLMFVGILLPLLLPYEVANWLIQRFVVTDPQNLTQQLPSMMLWITVYPIYQGALILAVSQRLAGQTPTPALLWKQGARFWFPLIAVNAMFLTVVFLGTMAFILPGIYLAIRLALAEQNVLLNIETPIEAFKSSWEDTSDQFWNIFLGSLLLGLFTLLMAYLIGLPFRGVEDIYNPVLIVPALIQSLLYPLFVIYYLRIRHYIQHSE